MVEISGFAAQQGIGQLFQREMCDVPQAVWGIVDDDRGIRQADGIGEVRTNAELEVLVAFRSVIQVRNNEDLQCLGSSGESNRIWDGNKIKAVRGDPREIQIDC